MGKCEPSQSSSFGCERELEPDESRAPEMQKGQLPLFTLSSTCPGPRAERRGSVLGCSVTLPEPSGDPGACAPVNGKQAPLILPWGEASLEGGAPSLPRLLPWCGAGPLTHSAWTRPSTSRRG